jgi:peptidoglycan/LPS O-acetylase OafA/YrhL
MDSLMFGVLLSYFYHFHTDGTDSITRRWRWPLLLIALALIVPEIYYPVENYYFTSSTGFTCLYVAFGLILLVSLTWDLPATGPASWLLRLLAFIGAHSYAIYLWHLPVKIWGPTYASRWFGYQPTPAHDLIMYLSVSILLGIALSIVIEIPTLAIRDRFFPSRSGPQESKPVASTPADQAVPPIPASVPHTSTSPT